MGQMSSDLFVGDSCGFVGGEGGEGEVVCLDKWGDYNSFNLSCSYVLYILGSSETCHFHSISRS